MGLRDWLSDAVDWVRDKGNDLKEKAKDVIDSLKGILGRSTYDYSSIECHIDVDKVLADVREQMQETARSTEQSLMTKMYTLFDDLKIKVNVRFPDLIEIIELEKNKAEHELRGSILQYVKEHLSKNDESFLKILEMQPGPEKERAIGIKTSQIISDATEAFWSKLKKYTQHISVEFSNRVDNRIESQGKQLNDCLSKMYELQRKESEGDLQIELLKDKYISTKEAAQCILNILEEEI